jgi:antitoxin MazE
VAKRRVFRSGNSVVVSLPEEALECLRVGVGEEVSLDLDWEKRELVLRPVPALPRGVDEEFARQVAEFIAEYRPALEALARE